MLHELVHGLRCAMRCGVDEVCHENMWKNGYCLHPKDREIGMALEYGEDNEKVAVMRRWSKIQEASEKLQDALGGIRD